MYHRDNWDVDCVPELLYDVAALESFRVALVSEAAKRAAAERDNAALRAVIEEMNRKVPS